MLKHLFKKGERETKQKKETEKQRNKESKTKMHSCDLHQHKFGGEVVRIGKQQKDLIYGALITWHQ